MTELREGKRCARPAASSMGREEAGEREGGRSGHRASASPGSEWNTALRISSLPLSCRELRPKGDALVWVSPDGKFLSAQSLCFCNLFREDSFQREMSH